MTWKLGVELCQNGFIVTTYDETYDEEQKKEIVRIDKIVFQQPEQTVEDMIENKEIVDVFKFIAEYFAVRNSKHNKHNLEIKWTGFEKDGN